MNRWVSSVLSGEHANGSAMAHNVEGALGPWRDTAGNWWAGVESGMWQWDSGLVRVVDSVEGAFSRGCPPPPPQKTNAYTHKYKYIFLFLICAVCFSPLINFVDVLVGCFLFALELFLCCVHPQHMSVRACAVCSCVLSLMFAIWLTPSLSMTCAWLCVCVTLFLKRVSLIYRQVFHDNMSV